MKIIQDLALLLAVLALVALAALSGVWMKKPEKKDKADGKAGVNVYVIVPPVATPPLTTTIPDAKHYPL